MPTSAVKFDATAVDVKVTDDQLLVVLADGRELAAPLAWFPRLAEAMTEQRKNWRLKQAATPNWYKRATSRRTRVQSGAARVAQHTPDSLRRPRRFF